jgi:hypothetical protein
MMRAFRNWRYAGVLQIACCGLAALLVAGCGAVKLAYEDGDTFTMFWVARYISLDAAQEAFARPRVEAWFHWHRTTQLPDYAHFAIDLQQRVRGPVTAAEMDEVQSQVRGRWHRMVDRATPDLADLALTLRTDQLPRIEKKFAANDATYQSDFVDASSPRRKKDLFNKELDRVEYWYGSLSAEQKAQLRKQTDALPIDPALWLAERQAREKEILALLRQVIEQKPPRETVIESLRSYALRLETSPDPGRRAYIDKLNKANLAMYLDIANMASPEQREHAADKLGDWIQDFDRLARD